MPYVDHYEKYLNEMQDDIDICRNTGRRIVFGYTSDTDVLLKIDLNEVNKIFEKYGTDDDAQDDNDTIGSMEDFARIISHYMINGLGGEADITDFDVVQYLLDHFKHRFLLGGTGAQGAAAMASAGMPVLAHITDRNRIVCNEMNYEGLESVKGGVKVPMINMIEGRPVYHVIFQYTKGDQFKYKGKEYVVPVANRMILDYDTIHKDIVVDESFRKYLEDNADQIISYIISGFNAVVDTKIAKQRMGELKEHYKRLKTANPNCIIYFESAHYLSKDVKKIVYSEISGYVDIMGMNEEELVVYTSELGHEIDKTDLKEVITGMDMIIDEYRINGIVLHTKDYAMYYGNDLCIDVDLEKAMTVGNLLSGTKARIGRYGNLSDCHESLKQELSQEGLRFAEEIEKMELKRKAYLVPSRYIEKPACTIGLGDTFVAGVQFALVKKG